MKGNLLNNSSFSLLQTIFSALAAVVLFKVTVIELGLEITGLWAYLSSINAVTTFGSFGFASALIYYIPKFKIDNSTQLKSLINTSFISVFVFSVLLSLVAYIIFIFAIPATVSAGLLPLAMKMLPLIVIALFFGALSTNFLSVLDGLMLLHVRSKIVIAGVVIYLSLGYFLILKIGILGLPVAQLVQNIFLLVASLVLVNKHIPSYRFYPEFNKTIFKSIFRYGFNFQVISITQIISEPFMKAVITKYSGSDMTAIFDLCVKLMSVFRNFLIAINQALVPQITVFRTMAYEKRIEVLYKTNLKMVILTSLLLFLSSIVLTDIISLFFINRIDSNFNFTLCNVALGLLINALAFPAHFFNLGLGTLRWNVLNNVITAGLIFISAPIVGELIGGKYIILCWSVPAIVGPCLLIYFFHRNMKLGIGSFLTADVWMLLTGFLVAGVVNHYINQVPAVQHSRIGIFVLNIFVLFAALAYPLYKNPTLSKMVRKVKLKYLKK